MPPIRRMATPNSALEYRSTVEIVPLWDSMTPATVIARVFGSSSSTSAASAGTSMRHQQPPTCMALIPPGFPRISWAIGRSVNTAMSSPSGREDAIPATVSS